MSGSGADSNANSFQHNEQGISLPAPIGGERGVDAEPVDLMADDELEPKVLIERWRHNYNTVRPHSSLGYRPPAP